MRRLLLAAALLTAAAPVHAQRADSAAFIIKLGNDTTVVERYVRTDDRLVVEAVQRSPSTVVHKLTLNLNAQGLATGGSYVVQRPAGGANLLERAVSGPQSGFLPVTGPFYSTYELALMQAARAKTPKTELVMRTTQDSVKIPFERMGKDTLSLTNQFGEPMRAHVDANGRLLHLNTPAFVTVERLKWVDLDALTKEFAGRDAVGKGLGQLSPRQTYRTRVGEANVWVDYSRPGARGRPIWGALVPFGRVWRMGANDAAHIAVDRTMQLGDVTLQPGTYTLYLLPAAANDWTLIVNKRTGVSGLDYNQEQDVGRVKLNVQPLERAAEQFTIDVRDGALGVAWGNMRGTAPLK